MVNPKSQSADIQIATFLSEQILKINAVSKVTTLSRATIYRLASEGKFPRPVKLSIRSSGWFASDISKWLSDLKEAKK